LLHLQSVSSFCPFADVVVTPGHVTHVSLLVAPTDVE